MGGLRSEVGACGDSGKFVSIEEDTDEHANMWYTLKKLIDNFGEEVALSMKAEKERDLNQWRPHPDAPTCKAATQYHVQEYDRKRHPNRTIETSETTLSADVEAAQAKIFMADRLKGDPSKSSSGMAPSAIDQFLGGVSRAMRRDGNKSKSGLRKKGRTR